MWRESNEVICTRAWLIDIRGGGIPGGNNIMSHPTDYNKNVQRTKYGVLLSCQALLQGPGLNAMDGDRKNVINNLVLRC